MLEIVTLESINLALDNGHSRTSVTGPFLTKSEVRPGIAPAEYRGPRRSKLCFCDFDCPRTGKAKSVPCVPTYGPIASLVHQIPFEKSEFLMTQNPQKRMFNDAPVDNPMLRAVPYSI
jgi:hypothetical protein